MYEARSELRKSTLAHNGPRFLCCHCHLGLLAILTLVLLVLCIILTIVSIVVWTRNSMGELASPTEPMKPVTQSLLGALLNLNQEPNYDHV